MRSRLAAGAGSCSGLGGRVFAVGQPAPADVRKDGTAFDLPIALGILIATGQLARDALEGTVVVGELGLDGAVRPTRGVLSVARRLAARSGATLVLPPANVAEASLVSTVCLSAPATLAELVAQLRGGELHPATPLPGPHPAAETCGLITASTIRTPYLSQSFDN